MMNGVRALSIMSYFLVSVQMNFNLLLVNATYPQNFYEVLRCLCAGYVSVIPSQGEFNQQYSYTIAYVPVYPQLVVSIPSW